MKATRFDISYEGELTAGYSPEEIEKHLDRVMDELVTLGVDDPSVGLAGRIVEVSLTVLASSPDAAAAEGAVLIRTALHAAGGCTDNWPKPEAFWALGWRQSRTRLTGLIDA